VLTGMKKSEHFVVVVLRKTNASVVTSSNTAVIHDSINPHCGNGTMPHERSRVSRQLTQPLIVLFVLGIATKKLGQPHTLKYVTPQQPTRHHAPIATHNDDGNTIIIMIHISESDLSRMHVIMTSASPINDLKQLRWPPLGSVENTKLS
jgi:hypothetical protein